MPQTVAVLGAGVAGMTAAHELALRGFSVTLVEARPELGGKSRSFGVPKSAAPGNRALPAEHGFRFFPHFYRHVPDSMSRIPSPRGDSVVDHLQDVSGMRLARAGKPDSSIPIGLSALFANPGNLARAIARIAPDVTLADAAFLASRLFVLLTSCERRRHAQWDSESWFDFIDVPNRSPEYRLLLGDSIIRTLVAAQAGQISARTAGVTMSQLLFSFVNPRAQIDRVLDAPTNEAWFDPWAAELQRLGVSIRTSTTVTGLGLDGSRIGTVEVNIGGSPQKLSPDWVVAALAPDRFVELMDPALEAADPALAGIAELEYGWMNGLMFYLDREIPIERGHTIYLDSPWALTSLTQAQFWSDTDFAQLGDGTIIDILSVDVSDWDTPGTKGKPARDCTPQEVAEEVWRQIGAHLDDEGRRLLGPSMPSTWFLDPSIKQIAGSPTQNDEPLLLNTPGSWSVRPEPTTAIENLFLAGDYVRTQTDLATMESANEAARRAVNALLDRSLFWKSRVRVFPLDEPLLLSPLRAADRVRWRLGLSNMFD